MNDTKNTESETNSERVEGLSCRVLLCFFIFSGKLCGCPKEREEMVALEVLPPWLIAGIVLVCPLLVVARLKWGPSPWDTQSHNAKADSSAVAD